MNELKNNAQTALIKPNTTYQSSAIKQEKNATAIANKEVVKTEVLQAKETTPEASGNSSENASYQVQEAVAKIKEYVQQTERTLDFKIDEDSGQTVVKVLDTSSDKLIRQIPSELALELAQRLNDEEPFSMFTAQV